MNQNQYKFKEGEVHSFVITGYKDIPGTDESFYILENPFGGKHLLKANPFKHYQLHINQKLNCTIDKINCSGKIYLEPENPIYTVGEIYDFDYEKTIDQINSVGENEKAAIVKDQFGMETTCSLPNETAEAHCSKTLACKVLRIKKGQLFLSLPNVELNNTLLEIGKKYWFTLIEIKELEKNIDYYILRDQFNNSYSLKKDMYEHYDFKINQQIECTVTKYNTDGHLKIEPVHPHYKIGKTYTFQYLRTEKEKDIFGKEEHVIIVKDIYGIETKVRSIIPIDIIPESFTDFLKCKVEGIRKGKAILSLLQNQK